MRRGLNFLMALAVFLSTLGVSFLTPSSAKAAFDPNDIIDDNIFTNVGTMSATQIDAFLNSYPNSCLSSNANSNGNPGFRTPEPFGYDVLSNSYKYGSNVTAGQAIYDVAQLYNVNPQVILSTLQKEQSLVTGSAGCHYDSPDPNWPAASPDSPVSGKTFTCTINGKSQACTYACVYSGGCVNIALGYGCPFYCSAGDEGFSKQLTLGTWLFRWAQQRAFGILTGYKGYESGDEYFCYVGPMTAGTRQRSASSSTCAGNPGNTLISYDGSYTTSDNVSVKIRSGATGSLYNFTPYTSGNSNFVTIFEQTFNFGSTRNPYNGAAYMSESPIYPALILNTGARRSVFIRFQNTGNTFWKDDLSNFPGWRPVHLATTFGINRASGFAAENWPSLSRPTGFISKVFNADGTVDNTPADQHTVQPGQIGEFDFTLYAKPNIPPGVYREYFQPIVEGAPGNDWNMGGWAYLDIGVHNPTYKTAYVQESPSTGSVTVQAGGPTQIAKFVIQNSNDPGGDPWLDDSGIQAMPGVLPVHFATTNPINRGSRFGSTWPSASRVNLTFSRVYDVNWNGDMNCAGVSATCLASAQNTVQPKQFVEFSVGFNAPAGTAPGNYEEYFQPIVESAPGNNWNIPFTNTWLLHITVHVQ